MNASDRRPRAAPAVVPPSRLVAVVMGPMTKALNPVMRKLAITLNGTDYRAVQPRLADREQAGPVIREAFGPVVRAMFRMLGIKQYLLLQRAESDG